MDDDIMQQITFKNSLIILEIEFRSSIKSNIK